MTGLEYLLLKQSKFTLIFALFLSSFIYSEAIVNVEDLRRDGEIGFFANISGSLSFSRGNRNRDSFSIQSSLDYNLEDLETFFVVKRSQKQINQKNYDSATLAHLRLNFLFDKDPSLETFIQYSKNPFRNLGIRGCHKLFELFHFKFTNQQVTKVPDGMLDNMTFKHVVDNKGITYYNLV